MLLKNKNAVIYGAGGAIGRAVALAFAEEGAKVFLTGRNYEKLIPTVNEIILNGGYAEFAQVDALKYEEVENHMKGIINFHNHIDVSFNLIGINNIEGISLVNCNHEQFESPINTAVKTQFITATIAAKSMMEKGSGVILMLSEDAAKNPVENNGGFGVACAAIEALSRQLAMELSRHNIRVNCLRFAGSHNSEKVTEVYNIHSKNLKFEIQFLEKKKLTNRPTSMEVANVAAIMASDKADSITAAIVNVTGNQLAD